MYEPKPAIPNEHGSAWIARNGDYYPVEGAEHWVVAMELGSTCRQLEDEGWVHFSYGSWYYYRTLSQRQMDVMFDLLIKAQDRNYRWFSESWRYFQRILDRGGKCRSTANYADEY